MWFFKKSQQPFPTPLGVLCTWSVQFCYRPISTCLVMWSISGHCISGPFLVPNLGRVNLRDQASLRNLPHWWGNKPRPWDCEADVMVTKPLGQCCDDIPGTQLSGLCWRKTGSQQLEIVNKMPVLMRCGMLGWAVHAASKQFKNLAASPWDVQNLIIHAATNKMAFSSYGETGQGVRNCWRQWR